MPLIQSYPEPCSTLLSMLEKRTHFSRPQKMARQIFKVWHKFSCWHYKANFAKSSLWTWWKRLFISLAKKASECFCSMYSPWRENLFRVFLQHWMKNSLVNRTLLLFNWLNNSWVDDSLRFISLNSDCRVLLCNRFHRLSSQVWLSFRMFK